MSVSSTIEATKLMNYVTFVVLLQDLGIDEPHAAYFFLICSRYNKEISADIAGPTFEDKCNYAQDVMWVRQSMREFLLSFPAFLEALFRLTDFFMDPSS